LTGAGRTGISDRGEAAEQDELTGANVPPGSPSPVVLSAAGTWPGGEPAAAAPVNAEAGLVEKEPRRGGGEEIQEGRDRAARHATPVPLRACSGLLPSYGTSWSGSDGAQHSTASVGPGLWPRLWLRSRPVHMCLSQPLDKNPHRSRGTSTPMCWASCTDNGHGGSTAQSCTGEHCSTPLKPTGAAAGIRLVSVAPPGVS
jgi:hypothetical protein